MYADADFRLFDWPAILSHHPSIHPFSHYIFYFEACRLLIGHAVYWWTNEIRWPFIILIGIHSIVSILEYNAMWCCSAMAIRSAISFHSGCPLNIFRYNSVSFDGRKPIHIFVLQEREPFPPIVDGVAKIRRTAKAKGNYRKQIYYKSSFYIRSVCYWIDFHDQPKTENCLGLIDGNKTAVLSKFTLHIVHHSRFVSKF